MLEFRRDFRFTRVGKNRIVILPNFVHSFGDPAHHTSMTRTGFSHRRFIIHEFLDDRIFYPINRFLYKYIYIMYQRSRKNMRTVKLGEFNRTLRKMKICARLHRNLRTILGFFWGLNCGFPLRDIAIYTVWFHRRCPPLAEYARVTATKKCPEGEIIKHKWIKIYPRPPKRTSSASPKKF